MTSGERATNCLNCGRDAGPGFCPYCGQEVDVRRGPLLDVGREVLSDWLSLDSRLMRSLRELLRPGRLSELYVAGRRAPFLRPFKLYLLASLVLFSTLLTLPVPTHNDFELRIGDRLVGPESDERVRTSLTVLSGGGTLTRVLAGDRIERLLERPRSQILDLLFDGLRRGLPSTLILFVPFLGLGLKLLYARGKARHTLYLEHLVFALHFQSALFLVLSLVWLVTRPLGLELLVASVVYGLTGMGMIAVYLPLALRRFYGQSWGWTAVKALVLLAVYKQLLGLAIEMSVLIGIWDV